MELSQFTIELNDLVDEQGKSIQWPGGVGAPENEGVSNSIRTTPNPIGYVELAYALTTGMTVGSVQNQAGNFIEPLESTKTAAAALAPQLPAGDRDGICMLVILTIKN